MQIEFHKYQGTGNDFVMIDNRSGMMPISHETLYSKLCDRKFGIGADGVILLEHTDDDDLKMVYYNADGGEGSMCGNGGRCFVHFANSLGYEAEELRFLACDGWHKGRLDPEGTVQLKMNDVESISRDEKDWVLDTGSPHLVRVVEDLNTIDAFSDGFLIRNSEKYRENGINVNFLQRVDAKTAIIRTFERGVEDLTLSCGTGVTACAIVMAEMADLEVGSHSFSHKTDGGQLQVKLDRTKTGFTNIWLCGPAEESFYGEISIQLYEEGERAPDTE